LFSVTGVTRYRRYTLQALHVTGVTRYRRYTLQALHVTDITGVTSSSQHSVRLVVELRRPELVEGSKRGGLLTRSVFGVGAEG